jgi:hypothetical protein
VHLLNLEVDKVDDDDLKHDLIKNKKLLTDQHVATKYSVSPNFLNENNIFFHSDVLQQSLKSRRLSL